MLCTLGPTDTVNLFTEFGVQLPKQAQNLDDFFKHNVIRSLTWEGIKHQTNEVL